MVWVHILCVWESDGRKRQFHRGKFWEWTCVVNIFSSWQVNYFSNLFLWCHKTGFWGYKMFQVVHQLIFITNPISEIQHIDFCHFGFSWKNHHFPQFFPSQLRFVKRQIFGKTLLLGILKISLEILRIDLYEPESYQKTIRNLKVLLQA